MIKIKLTNKANDRLLFVLDQIVPLFIITIAAAIYFPYKINFSLFYTAKSLLFLLARLSIIFVCSIIMKTIMNKWISEEDKTEDS